MRQTELPYHEAAILTRIAGPDEAAFSAAAAKGILTLGFNPADKDRMHTLAAKAAQARSPPMSRPRSRRTAASVASLASSSPRLVAPSNAARVKVRRKHTEHAWIAQRELVWRRAGNCCEYGRMPREYDDTTFEIDHVIATSHGGPTRAAHLCLACFAWKSQT